MKPETTALLLAIARRIEVVRQHGCHAGGLYDEADNEQLAAEVAWDAAGRPDLNVHILHAGVKTS